MLVPVGSCIMMHWSKDFFAEVNAAVMFGRRLSPVRSVLGDMFSLPLCSARPIPRSASRQGMGGGMCVLAFSEQVSAGFPSA